MKPIHNLVFDSLCKQLFAPTYDSLNVSVIKSLKDSVWDSIWSPVQNFTGGEITNSVVFQSRQKTFN